MTASFAVFDIQSGHSWFAAVGFEEFTRELDCFREAPFAWGEVADRINELVVNRVKECDGQSGPCARSSAEDSPTDLFDLVALHAGTSKITMDDSTLVPGCHYFWVRYLLDA